MIPVAKFSSHAIDVYKTLKLLQGFAYKTSAIMPPGYETLLYGQGFVNTQRMLS
jgi:hypothetical protein